MIVVTGGAGFIGANIVKALNARGRNDVMVVDDLRDGTKFVNLADCTLADYLDKDDFLARVKAALRGDSVDLPKIDAIFHEGACSDTTEWDGHYMMENNFEYSKVLLNYCEQQNIPFLFASSAATYGGSEIFREAPECEKPLNVYGYSKLLFDQHVRSRWSELTTQVVGFRYFNVYGPREQHKGKMASVAYHNHLQIRNGETLKLFGAYDGFEAGMQSRDFVYVGDVVDVTYGFWIIPNSPAFLIWGLVVRNPLKRLARRSSTFTARARLTTLRFPKSLKGAIRAIPELISADYVRVAAMLSLKPLLKG